MSVSKYQMFLKTVECGSFSKAAEAMNFTQSGISHAINSLENELGVQLFVRRRSGVTLTPAGQALARYAPPSPCWRCRCAACWTPPIW